MLGQASARPVSPGHVVAVFVFAVVVSGSGVVPVVVVHRIAAV